VRRRLGNALLGCVRCHAVLQGLSEGESLGQHLYREEQHVHQASGLRV